MENSRKKLKMDEHILKDIYILKLNILGCENISSYLVHLRPSQELRRDIKPWITTVELSFLGYHLVHDEEGNFFTNAVQHISVEGVVITSNS
jgi:hypothetical protein